MIRGRLAAHRCGQEVLTLTIAPKQGNYIAGERACPPEDVGGLWGYERLLEIIAGRDDPEYAETIRWCGGYFEPEWFDLSIADKDVAMLCVRTSSDAYINRSRKRFRRKEKAMGQGERLEGI